MRSSAARFPRSANPHPRASINFVTAHDGFTLRDLVSYSRKHNMGNGEGGRDGEAHNHSWNCGVEGETDDPAVQHRRTVHQRTLLCALLLSTGTPMLTMGACARQALERGRSSTRANPVQVMRLRTRAVGTTTLGARTVPSTTCDGQTWTKVPTTAAAAHAVPAHLRLQTQRG